MRLKSLPFLISLVLLASLIALLPILFNIQESVSVNSALIGLFPGFGLGLVLATCSYEKQAAVKGLLFVPLASLLGMAMAILCWVLALIVGPKPLLLALGYGAVNVFGALVFFALVRKVYATKVVSRKTLPAACASAAPALMLLFFPLTLLMHGVISALWVACLGVLCVLRAKDIASAIDLIN